MNTRPQHRISRSAFTLIELLTVITIIAILMGLLFPAINIVKEQARRTEAKAAVVQIGAAVKAYYTEYGKYPPLTAAANGDTTVGNSGSPNSGLFYTLQAKSVTPNAADVLNPRKIVFFEGKTASDPANPKSGFGSDGNFYDPWGKQYVIVMDTNYNNVINLQGTYSDFTEQADSDTGARTGVGVYSLGKDGVLGSPTAKPPVSGKYRDGNAISDDVISWQ